jgi:hypothetical protein
MIELTLLIGFIGMGLILIAFLMNQMHKWNQDSIKYDLINLIGSGFLCFYSLMINSIPFLVLNLVWFLFSLKDVIKFLTNRNRTNSTKTS